MTHRGSLIGVLLLLVCASFAGCLADGDKAKPAPAADTTPAVTDSTKNNTTAGGPTTDVPDTNGEAVPTSAPIAAFLLELNGTTLAVGDSFTANASATTDDDTPTENLTFTWDFGDGTTMDGMSAVHSFAAEGNYTIILNVTDPDGNSDSANETVVVVSGFTPGVIGNVAGTIALPNPLVGELASGYSQLVSAGACASALACYQTVGGVEGQQWALHVVSGIPLEAGSVIFEDIASSTTRADFALFDMDGNKLGGNNIGPNTAASTNRKITLAEPLESVQVFVFMHIGASGAYDIQVTTVAPEA